MIRHLVTFLIEAFLFLGCVTGIARSAPAVAQEKQQAMTNSDVIEMVRSGMSEDAIIGKIMASTPDFQITSETTSGMIEQNVPEKVVLAMIRHQLQWDREHRKSRIPTRPARDKSSIDSKSKWEIEFHGGTSWNRHTGGWKKPPEAETYSLAGSGAKGYWGKRVSSWYFGDGADLIGLSSSLDALFARSTPIVRPQGNQMFGLRVSRSLNKWIAAEFTLDRGNKWAITDDVIDLVEAVRVSFENQWSRLNVPGNTPVSSVSTISADGGRQTFMTGAAVFSLPQAHRISPYFAVGAGVVSQSNSTPGITLAGSYGGPSALETDTVHFTLNQSGTRTFTQVIGGGVKIYLTRHWGIRADIRAYLYKNPITAYLDANHTNTPDVAWIINATDAAGESVAFLQKLTGPGLDAYTTLSGPSISGLRTFFGSGNQRQVPITIGLFWTF